jgi:hypothetical protein
VIDNYERLVGRLMDLETKFYELQDKYQNLIDSYEKLKETHENCSRHRDELGTRYDPFNRYSGH